jgi:putative heme-binding domain-containing protein
LVRNLLRRDEDATDSRQPLLLWWAIEAKADSNRAEVVALLEDKSLWPHPLVKTYLLERLMRRYAAAGSRQDLLTCAKLLQLSPDAGSSILLLAGFENAFKGRSVAGLPEELTVALAKASDNPVVLGLRQGDEKAVAEALRVIADPAGDKKLRLQYVQILGEVHQAKGLDVLLKLLGETTQTNLHKAALTSLQSFPEHRIGAEVIKQFDRLNTETRAAAFSLLASRPAWAEQLLGAVVEGKIAKDSVPQDARCKMKGYSSPEITALMAKCWGAERVPTTGEMRQRITHLTGTLRDGSGSPYEGQKLFNAACAACHRLFNVGGQIGPDLTAFKRDDLDTMLLSIINPSAEIREGFENYTVATKDGRTLSGFLTDKDQRVVVLRGIDGENVTVPQEQIQEMKSAGISLMPEGLLDGMDEQQIRHLFAYLRSTQPLVR